MIRSLAIVCLWLLATLSPALARSCMVPNIRTLDNQTVSGFMYATSGKRCSIVVNRSHGPMHSARLVSSPSNGSVSVSGGRVVYTSRAGYVGDDRFVYSRQGLNALHQPITRTVEVTVKVAARQ